MQIVIGAGNAVELNLQLRIDRLQLLIDGLQLFLARLQLFRGRAVFLIDGLQFLIGGAKILIGGLELLTARSQMRARQLQLFLQVSDRGVGGFIAFGGLLCRLLPSRSDRLR